MITSYSKWMSAIIALGLLITNSIQAQHAVFTSSPSNDNRVVEVSIFQFKADVDEAAALRLAQSVNDFLISNDGFISRKCSKTPEGQWVDVIYWKNRAMAEAAAEKAFHNPTCLAFFDQIITEQTTFLLAEEVFVTKP